MEHKNLMLLITIKRQIVFWISVDGGVASMKGFLEKCMCIYMCVCVVTKNSNNV